MVNSDIQTLKDAQWLIGKLAGSLGIDISELSDGYNDSYEELGEIISRLEALE